MQIAWKAVILSALLTGVVAIDIQYCSSAESVCKDITFQSTDAICYGLDPSIGAIDTVIGLTAGVAYTVFTGAACTGDASEVFGAGVTTLADPFLGNVLSVSVGVSTAPEVPEVPATEGPEPEQPVPEVLEPGPEEPQPQEPEPSKWTALGCFTDFAGARTLPAGSHYSPTLTIEQCQNFCDASDFGFAGVEFGSECWCDHSIKFPSVQANSTSDCGVPCGGNTNQTCGGTSFINIFSSGKPLPTTPDVVVDPKSKTEWKYSGCFTDNSLGVRTLPLRLQPITGGVTPQACAETCAAIDQTIAGVEFGEECWCGTEIYASAAHVDDVQCATACKSNPAFFCGNNNRLNIYEVVIKVGPVPEPEGPAPEEPGVPNESGF
ncbi:hypothetical protein DXG03_007933 [Asterophora parasitica]|uniref:WSC domain-containing protein n=1 Tax=Asterophora parasitica TaxID=117018 RepID=A0A9P7GCD7_9AGAR|nr:hypothetical protein DXG03_007933 [Asterophora parasitica]